MENQYQTPSTPQKAIFKPPRSSKKDPSLIIESIRLFSPLIMTLIFSCAFTTFIVTKLHELPDLLEESNIALDENAEKLLSLEDSKKIILADIIIEDDMYVLKDFNNSMIKIYKVLKMIIEGVKWLASQYRPFIRYFARILSLIKSIRSTG